VKVVEDRAHPLILVEVLGLDIVTVKTALTIPALPSATDASRMRRQLGSWTDDQAPATRRPISSRH
jgi:hypothetical protein